MEKNSRFSCEICNFVCSQKSDIKRHLTTRKHIKTANEQSSEINAFVCNICDFICSKTVEWKRHIQTKKHVTNTLRTEITLRHEESTDPQEFKCEKCNKVYKSRTGLWYHARNSCVNVLQTSDLEAEQPIANDIVETPVTISIEESHAVQPETRLLPSDVITKDMFLQLMEQNRELLDKVMELSTERNVTNNNNTTNNAQFNLNFFLNEKCKDAINFSEFMNSLTMTQDDLQTVIKHGFVEGNSIIIGELFKQMGPYRRPIHCTDPKRETVYIKENDEWEKENIDLPRIQKLVSMVAHKVRQQTNIWHQDNPDYKNSREKKDESLLLMCRTMGNGEGTTEQTHKKIMKNIMMQTEINKSLEKGSFKK
jgi:hypothetical protein